MSLAFLTADWKNLVMANYIIDPEVLIPYLPAKTSLDLFNGKAFISLVGFMFLNTKLLGFKIPFHTNFEEVNLRFYVRYNENGEWKRGTVFIKEIVPKPAISFIANSVYHEKYCTKRMKHFFKRSENECTVGYSLKHKGKWNKIEARTELKAIPAYAGSEEAFIADHYWGYSKYNDNTTFEYNVQHQPWKTFPVKEYLIDFDFGSLYGTGFSVLEKTKPASVFVAEGSAISILKKRKL